MNVQQLIHAGIKPTAAKQFVEPLEVACRRFDILTPVRQAAFIAQASYESAGFTQLEENLFYTTPERVRQMFSSTVPSLADAARLVRNPQALANTVYANRLGNGPAVTGDGWRYRGRGLFQLTGRSNYQVAEEATGHPYTLTPSLVSVPVHAAITAAWFWAKAGLNAAADNSDIDLITRRINGPAMAGLIERRNFFRQALEAFA